MKNIDAMQRDKYCSLYDLLEKEIKRMIDGIGKKGNGNIHPLIMNEMERYIIEVVLCETNFNYVVATKLLGISRSTLYRKIEALGINESGLRPLRNDYGDRGNTNSTT